MKAVFTYILPIYLGFTVSFLWAAMFMPQRESAKIRGTHTTSDSLFLSLSENIRNTREQVKYLSASVPKTTNIKPKPKQESGLILDFPDSNLQKEFLQLLQNGKETQIQKKE